MPDPRQNVVSQAAVSIAEKARPNWRVVPAVQATADVAKADASTPELSTILNKYLGANAVRAAVPAGLATSELVTMEPINSAEAAPGRKVVLVQNGVITGEQG